MNTNKLALDALKKLRAAIIKMNGCYPLPNREGYLAMVEADEAIAALVAEAVQDEPLAWVPDMAHVANEWADVACNGLAWLQNVRDGISTVETAIRETEAGLNHCRAVARAEREPSLSANPP